MARHRRRSNSAGLPNGRMGNGTASARRLSIIYAAANKDAGLTVEEFRKLL